LHAGFLSSNCFISARKTTSNEAWILYPIVAKVGGLQSQGAKGEAVVNLLRSLGNAGSGVFRLSRGLNNMALNRPHPLNLPGLGNQKGKNFYDFYLKLE
jgi:hypothetical protein